ncbi:MAG: glycosyltransferase family 4 protein [Thermotogota bacterium]|nr:glycosyltransferase family 4 protein [Thermotogota bacterium]
MKESEKKENVLIISPFFRPNIGGVETHLDDLCEYLRKHGHKVFVITYQPLTTKAKGPKLERKENLEIRRIQWFGYNWFHKLESYPILEWLYLSPGLFLYSLIFLSRNMKQIDVIHAHGFVSSFITKILSKFFKKRSVMSTHAIYHLENRPLFAKIIKWMLSSFDVILALAERSKKDLIGAGLPENRIKIYTQWVDQNRFKPINHDECRKELGLNHNFIVLFIGRLIEKKGIKVLLKAASLVNSNVKFVVIGDGPLATDVKAIASKQENIIFSGKVSGEDVVKYYNIANIFIIPSQYEEGFARVNLEALSCGTPILAANRGCLPEIVDSSVGVLIDPAVENIAQKIEHLYTHPDKLKELTSNCRPYAEQHFSERNASSIENAYKT